MGKSQGRLKCNPHTDRWGTAGVQCRSRDVWGSCLVLPVLLCQLGLIPRELWFLFVSKMN